jgi:PKD repeat protein
MKKTILSALGVVAFAAFAISQTTPTGNWCASDQIIQKQMDADPNFQSVLHNSMMNAAQSRTEEGGSRAVITVPVVFHIIHDNGVGNISDEQIYDALAELNIDYNRWNPDTTNTRNDSLAPFAPQAAGMDIEFKLAKIDPNNQCTNGIVRVNAPHLTYDAGEDCKQTSLGGSDQWTKSKYFNIWVVNSIDNDGGAGITLGYAYLPYGGGGGDGYGILIRQDWLGTIGTAAGGDGATLTHEMGHSLGLSHPFNAASWGGSTGCHTNDCSSNGDYCCDTPPQDVANFSCNASWNSCNEIPSGDTYGFDAYDQIENYMSYNSCQNMFSKDQVNIMDFNFSDISFLSSMITSGNLVATGVNTPDVLCTAEFSANQTSVCAGQSVTFTDASFNFVNGWTWTFVGGTPSTSALADPVVVYDTPGMYEVILTATDGSNSDTETKSSYIRVLPTASSLPFIESFEPYTTLTNIDQWEIYNPAGNGFSLHTGTGHTGSKCAKLTNFGESENNSDELISSPIDLSVISSEVTMSFRYSYRKRYTANDEWLKVFISADCGDAWAQRKTIHGPQLSSIAQNSAWTPTSQADWVTVHMLNVTSAYWTDNYRVKFEFESDGGNNFYLDDINIYSGAPSDELVVGVNDIQFDIDAFSVYPNPTENELNVRFSLKNAENAQLTVQDVSGKIVQMSNVHSAEGANLVMMNTSEFAGGMYFLKIQVGGTQKTIQFVVK